MSHENGNHVEMFQEIAYIKATVEHLKEREERHTELLDQTNMKLDMALVKISEAQGALRFAKWAIPILGGGSGVSFAAIWQYLTGGKN